MPRTLVIPDIHNRIGFVDDLIRRTKPDEVVFLGDYFDAFDDTPEDAERTARWLKARLHLPGYHFLLGNHDANYRWPKCPWHLTKAYNKNKQDAIDRVLSKSDWQRMLFAVQRGNWWFTHAGLHPGLFPAHPVLGFREQDVWDKLHDAEFRCEVAFYTPITDEQRGPDGIVSGPLWLRWYEFVPIPGVNQVVGHTRYAAPQTNHVDGSLNFNIDCDNRYYGILENDKFETFSVDEHA